MRDVQVHQLQDTGFRIVFVPLPGPLVSCSIVIPTSNVDSKGLPHTLEHLIFCGSRNHPQRGFLDSLAVRSLSSGTNAYTSEDHTCYEVTTIGREGMMNVLPVFLDHILHPTLTESQFMTEVYHLDGSGKHQGVVYCEMKARQDTESDLGDLNIRQSLYTPTDTYYHECGGLLEEIKKVTNEEVFEDI